MVRLVGHTGGVNAVAFAPGGARLATASYDGYARVWSVPDGRTLRELTVEGLTQGHPPEARAAAFSPNGEQLFVGFADGRGRLFKLPPRPS